MKWLGKMNATLALAEGGSNTEGTGEMVSVQASDIKRMHIIVYTIHSWAQGKRSGPNFGLLGT